LQWAFLLLYGQETTIQMSQPIFDRVLIKADPVADKTKSGLLLQENWKTLPLMGEVLAVGDSVTSVKPGDRVSFMRYATIILEDDERLCTERHIYATL
jgi:chaperonin GroES